MSVSCVNATHVKKMNKAIRKLEKQRFVKSNF